MAHLKQARVGKWTYLYVVQSVRRGDKVSKKVLEYLGRTDKVDPDRLARALRYWRVGVKPKRNKGGRS